MFCAIFNFQTRSNAFRIQFNKLDFTNFRRLRFPDVKKLI